MNIENKYRRPFRVFGILTLVSFFLTVLFFFLFAVTDKTAEQSRLDAFALLTLLFTALFVGFMIVFLIFSVLKGTEDRRNRRLIDGAKKAMADNVNQESNCPHCGAIIHSSAIFCPSCGKKIGEEEESKLIFTYEDAKPLKCGSYLKGYYYSGMTIFYAFLACAFAFLASTLYLVLAKPEFELASFFRNSFIVLTVLFFALLILVFVLTPLLMAKKNKVNRQTVQLYDDKIAVLTSIKAVEGIQNANSFVRTEYSYVASKKAKKDKEAYYFFFVNEKGTKVILMVGYRDRPQFTAEMQKFLDEKMRLINKMRQSKL